MKKIIIILTLILTLVLTGCSKNNSNNLEEAYEKIRDNNFTVFVNETIVYEYDNQSNNFSSQYIINVDKDKMLYTKDNIKKYYEKIDDLIYQYSEMKNEWTLNTTININEFKYAQLDFLSFEINENYVQNGKQCNLDKNYINSQFKETLNRYCILTFGNNIAHANLSQEITKYSIFLNKDQISIINIEIELNSLSSTNNEKYKISLGYNFSNFGTTVVNK